MGYEFEPEDGEVVDRVMTVFRPEFDGDGCVEDETLGAWGARGPVFHVLGGLTLVVPRTGAGGNSVHEEAGRAAERSLKV